MTEVSEGQSREVAAAVNAWQEARDDWNRADDVPHWRDSRIKADAERRMREAETTVTQLTGKSVLDLLDGLNNKPSKQVPVVVLAPMVPNEEIERRIKFWQQQAQKDPDFMLSNRRGRGRRRTRIPLVRIAMNRS